MSDLEDKLREILLSPYKYPKGDGATMFDDKGDIPILDTQIAQILRAVKEAGYEKFTVVTERFQIDADHKPTATRSRLQSGQQWYDRFEEELHDLGTMQYMEIPTPNGQAVVGYPGHDVFNAAKKASGLA